MPTKLQIPALILSLALAMPYVNSYHYSQFSTTGGVALSTTSYNWGNFTMKLRPSLGSGVSEVFGLTDGNT